MQKFAPWCAGAPDKHRALWNENSQVIPFYFEVQDYEQWLMEFADAYYRTFINLDNKLSEADLEEKRRTLEYGDLITQGVNNFRYGGIADDILDLILRELSQEEIDRVKPNIAQELRANLAALEK